MAIKPIEIIIRARDEASAMLTSVQAKVAAVAVAVAGFFGIGRFAGAIRSASEFEASMSRLKAAAGATDDEFKLLKQTAEDVGSNTKYTSVEAAAALENLAKAGLNVKDSLAALPAVLALAQAGDVGLAQSAEYVTKAVMGMGLAFSDSARVADVLAMGANASNTSVVGLAQALSYAAPTAKTLGLSLELTVAIIGKFADAGIDASRAGTALNAIMGQFSDPASKFRQELGNAGIITNNFEQALRELAKAGPAGAKAINAVGLEAGPALKALLGQGIGALDDLKGKLDDSAGSANKMAQVMQDNLSGSMTSLGSVWTTVKNVLGAPVLPVLKDGVDQLSGALRGMITDGTIGKFGEAMSSAFQGAIKWARDFIAQVNFTQIAADMRAFADSSRETFDRIGEYASTAGNTVKLAYGVMSAGVNTVLAAVYGIGSVWAEVAEAVMGGIAKLRDGMATITFGEVSKNFKLAAEDARNMAQGFGDAAQAMRDKASAAMQDVAQSAQVARNGFSGLAGAINTTKPAADASAQAMAGVAQQLQAAAEKTAAARKATEEKKAADEGAAVAMRQLKAEYADLIAKGDLQAAAQKIQEINKALRDTPAASKDAAKAAQEAAQAIADAFMRQGVTSSAELKQFADGALRDFNIIKNSGTATAADLTAMFRNYAEKAIAANGGVATETLKSQAAMRGLSIEADATGKSIVKSMGEGAAAIDKTSESLGRATVEANKLATALVNAKYSRPGEGASPPKPGDSKDNYDPGYGSPYSRPGEDPVNGDGKTKAEYDRAQSLKGQNAADYTLQFKLLEKSQNGTLSAADVEDAKRYLEAQKQNNVVNRDLDRVGGAFSAAGSLDRNKWERFQAVMQNFVDAQKNIAPTDNTGDAQRPPANTYVSNITIDGKTTPIRTSDAQSQSSVDDLVRQLAAARRTASR